MTKNSETSNASRHSGHQLSHPPSNLDGRPFKPLLGEIPASWGQKVELEQQAVSITNTGPGSVQYTASAHFIIVLLTAQPRRELSLNTDRKICGLAPIGSLEIVPARSDVYARWETPKENLLVATTEARLRYLAGTEEDREDFELYPMPLGTIDPRALYIAQHIRAELQSTALAYVESIESWLTLLMVHILRHHSSLGSSKSRKASGGLSPRIWKRVNEYILENISDKLTLETLAAVAQLSPSHFSRAFRQTANESPHQYIISARLNRARELITETRLPFNIIALRSGFTNNSHMTALMNRIWGITPTRLRNNP